ncbi:MAG TPA: diacylglycerol kinase family protein [Edaphocola sp.]|nr:diacylglycerol kinase family protein [Edaphocola sp.]
MNSRTKALFIINPNAGTDRVKALKGNIEAYLDKGLFDYEIAYTEYARHGTILAKEGIEKGFELIIAVGGDGSVNDIINGIYGSNAVLGILPKGSGNGLARSLHLPLKASEAVQRLNRRHIRTIDLGMAQGHLFASNAGVGYDTVVTEAFSKSTKRGLPAYLSVIMKTVWRYPVKEWHLEIDGRASKIKAFMLTVANAFQLGYGFQIAPNAELEDGFLDVVSIRKFPKLLAGTVALRAFTGKIQKSPYVHIQKARHIRISHPDLTRLQIDGESLPCTSPVDITILPKSLKVLI